MVSGNEAFFTRLKLKYHAAEAGGIEFSHSLFKLVVFAHLLRAAGSLTLITLQCAPFARPGVVMSSRHKTNLSRGNTLHPTAQ